MNEGLLWLAVCATLLAAAVALFVSLIVQSALRIFKRMDERYIKSEPHTLALDLIATDEAQYRAERGKKTELVDVEIEKLKIDLAKIREIVAGMEGQLDGLIAAKRNKK